MGADFYGYYVPYQEDRNKALQELRLREFEAGRYRAALADGLLTNRGENDRNVF